MTASRSLGALRGLSEETLKEIDRLHEKIDNFTVEAIKSDYNPDYVQGYLQELEYTLQELWKFDRVDKYHTYYKKYLFRKSWYGRKFKCLDTGAEVVLGLDVYECQFIPVGEGAIDLGRYGAYSRVIGNVKEVFDVQ